jgi:hypothetical protein
VATALFLGATATGFVATSSFGRELIRFEAQEQLARLLRGEVAVESARLVVADGLWLEGRGINAYPAKQGDRAGLPALSAERASARLDILAMLTGRFALRELRVEGLHLRLERFAPGVWSLPPLEAMLAARPPALPGDHERKLGILRASEAITRMLLARPLAANRIRLHFATVRVVDHVAGLPGDEPLTLHFRGIEGRLDHIWLADEAELSLRAQLTDSVGRRCSLELSGERRDGGQHLTLAATDLPLAMLAPYLAKAGPGGGADGRVSGVVAYRTPRAKHGVLELDWLIRDLDASIPLRQEPLHIQSPRLALQSRIEIHPGRLRLAELALEGLGGAGELSANGVVERPLRDSARARLSISVRGTGLTELRRIVSWLPETDARPMTQLLEQLSSGHIERIQATGGARVSQWRRLVQGESESLPEGFVLATDVADIAVATDGAAALTDLSARAQWSGDRITLGNVAAKWKGVPLPPLDATIDGLSHLLRGAPDDRQLRGGAEPISGLGTLWRVLAGERHDGPAAPLPEMNLVIDALDHPALLWPIRNTRLRIAPTPPGLAIEADQGTWAGAPFQAEAVLLREPAPHWKVAIAISEPSAPGKAKGSADPPRSGDPIPGEDPAWFRGRVRVGSLEAAGLPASGLEARVALEGTTLTLTDVAVQMTPTGVISGNLVVDLGTSERLAVEVDAELWQGDLAQIAPLVGLGQDQWSGQLSFKASLKGWVDPEQPLLAELSGPVFVLSRQGELQREIPMVLALAQMTEGFNPFAASRVARYESVEMTLQLDRGRISTDDLELEGPIRVYARGFLDVARPDPQVDAVVGVFLFRQADRTLGRVPLLSHLISNRGLVGGYFGLTGSAEDPAIRSLPLNSLAAAIPDAVKAPFRALGALGRLLGGKGKQAPPAKPSPDWPASADEWRQTIRPR